MLRAKGKRREQKENQTQEQEEDRHTGKRQMMEMRELKRRRDWILGRFEDDPHLERAKRVVFDVKNLGMF